MMYESELNGLMPLTVEQTRRIESLRERMQVAGCVFDFTVRGLESNQSSPSETEHRAILGDLFRELSEQVPSFGWTPRLDLKAALAMHWPSECITDPCAFLPKQRIESDRDWASVSEFEWLFQAFDNPPYSAKCEPGLFATFCEVVGLWPNRNIVVLDWVGDPDAEPDRSNWCDYFDQGKEWWGIWCLTVWNPELRTLSALAASTTD